MIGEQGKDLKNHFAWAKIHSPLLENNAVCGFSRPSAGRLVPQRAELPEDRRPRGGGCQAASGPAQLCSVAGGQDPAALPSSEHLSSFPLHGERVTFPHPTLLFPAGLHVVFPDGRCPLPPSQQLWVLGEGRALSSASFALARSCVPGISQQQVL